MIRLKNKLKSIPRKQPSLVEILESSGFHQGRMITISKSAYRKIYPDNLIIFNAKIYNKELYTKIQKKEIPETHKLYNEELWCGDLDLTFDLGKIYKAIHNRRDIVITHENREKLLELEGIFKFDTPINY